MYKKRILFLAIAMTLLVTSVFSTIVAADNSTEETTSQTEEASSENIIPNSSSQNGVTASSDAEEKQSEIALPKEDTEDATKKENPLVTDANTSNNERGDASNENITTQDTSPRSDGFSVTVIEPADEKPTEPGIQHSLQTFEDPKLNTTPSDISLRLHVISGTATPANTKIIIPLDFIPDGNGTAPYENFTMDTAIYDFILEESDLGRHAEATIDESVTPHKLILTVEEGYGPGQFDMVLRFRQRDEYCGNIPPGTKTWTIKPQYIYNEVINTDLPVVDIYTTAKENFTTSLGRSNPSSESYPGGTISINTTVNNREQWQTLLDKDRSYIYVKVPKDSAVSASTDKSNGTKPLTDPAIGYVKSSTETIGGREYDVYKKQMDNTSNTWTNMNHNNALGETFDRLYPLYVDPPATLLGGEDFYIYAGAEFTRVNGVSKRIDRSLKYTRTADIPWTLESNRYHGHSSGLASGCGINPGDVGNADLYSNEIFVGYSNYYHKQSGIWNIGPGNGNEVELALTNGTTASSAKLNFNEIRVYGLYGNYPKREENLVGSLTGTPCYYKLKFEISNAKDPSIPARYESLAPRTGRYTVTNAQMPALEEHEYYSKVSLIPMGADGKQEGVWLPGNSMAFSYQPKAWDTGVWPDGTPVPNENSIVTMRWTLTSDNADASKSPLISNPREVTYLASKTAIEVNAEMFTATPNRSPGNNIVYRLNGYNNLRKSRNNWVNPYLIVAVSKNLELQNPSTGNSLVRTPNGASPVTVPDVVSINKLNYEDSDNYFYEIQVNHSIPATRDQTAFYINLNFKVSDDALIGRYPIPYVLASSEDKPNFFLINSSIPQLNNATVEETLGLSAPNRYIAFFNNHTTLNIIEASVTPRFQTSAESTGLTWSNNDIIPVEGGEPIGVRMGLYNHGYQAYTNVKLYNIIPYEGNDAGTEDYISFQGLSNVPPGAKVWYSITKPADLPEYGSINMATYNPANHTEIWSLDTPTDLTSVTAVFIHFPGELARGNGLTVDVKLKIASEGKEADIKNQFKYFANEVGSPNVIQDTSVIKTYTTDAISLFYESGSDKDDVRNMPANVSKRTADGDMTIVIDTKIPDRTGYTFRNWEEKDNPGATYNPSDAIDFSTLGENKKSIILEAQWNPDNIKVIYDVNGGNPINPSEYMYQYDSVLSVSDLPPVPPTREGYIFRGWSFSNIATEPNFGEGSKITFTTTERVYAVWEKEYSLTVSKQTIGNFADLGLDFDFTVAFTDANDNPIQNQEFTYIKYTGDTPEQPVKIATDNEGKFIFKLKHNQSVVITGFASGTDEKTKYTVTETQISDYTPYINSVDNGNGDLQHGESSNTTTGIINNDKDTRYVTDRFYNVHVSPPTTSVTTPNTHILLLSGSIIGLGFMIYIIRHKKLRRLQSHNDVTK